MSLIKRAINNYVIKGRNYDGYFEAQVWHDRLETDEEYTLRLNYESKQTLDKEIKLEKELVAAEDFLKKHGRLK
jgi:hypothetical protein